MQRVYQKKQRAKEYTLFLPLLLLLLLQNPMTLPGDDTFRLVLLPLAARLGMERGEADSLTLLIGTELSEQGGAFLQIVEAPGNEDLISEQRFQRSGLTSEGDAFEFGRRIDANMILTGFTHRDPGGVIVAVLLYDTSSGSALAARSFIIREEAVESDISYLVSQIITDLKQSQHAASPAEVHALIDTEEIEEANRLYSLLDPAEPELALLSRRISSLQRKTVENLLAKEGDTEELFLYLALSRDIPDRGVMTVVLERERKNREAEREAVRDQFNQALEEGRFEAAGNHLDELRLLGEDPEVVATGAERLHHKLWNSLMRSARLSLLRSEGTRALYYSVEALKIAPLEENLLMVAARADDVRSRQRERELFKEGETGAFTYGTRTGPMAEAGALLGITHDPLAKRSYRGTGYGLSGSYRFFRDISPPLSLEQGVHLSWNYREGELESAAGDGIEIITNYLGIDCSLGISARFANFDAGMGLHLGVALFLGKNGEDEFLEPAFLISPEIVYRYFTNRHLFFGTALTFPSFLMFETPGTGGISFSLKSGWSF